MKCNHKFKGTADGVVCMLCGEKLTVKEYLKLIEPKPKKKGDKKSE